MAALVSDRSATIHDITAPWGIPDKRNFRFVPFPIKAFGFDPESGHQMMAGRSGSSLQSDDQPGKRSGSLEVASTCRHLVVTPDVTLDEASLARLLDAFYTRVRGDALIGPVFAAVMIEETGPRTSRAKALPS